MKKLGVIAMGVIFLLSLTGAGLAQEKAGPGKSAEAVKKAEPAKPAEPVKVEGAKPGKAAKAEKKVVAKPAQYRMGGVVTAIDAKAKKITIKQQRVKKERTAALTMTKEIAKKLSDLKVGDTVNVWVSGGRITVLQKL